MQNGGTDWKRYLIFLTIVFVVLVVYDYFVTTQQATRTLQNETRRTEEVKPVKTAEVNLYLGSEREKLVPKEFVEFDLQNARIKVALEGAKLVSVYDKKFKRELIEPYERAYNIYPLEILTPSWETTKVLNFSKYDCKKEDLTLVCSMKNGTVEATKVFKFSPEGYLTQVEVNLKGVEKPYLYLGMTPDEDPFFTHIGPLFKTTDGEVLRINIEDVQPPQTLHGDFLWSAEEGRYFIKAARYETDTAVIFKVSYLKDGETKFVGATAIAIEPRAQVLFLGGPKEYELLKKVDFVEAIDFGVLKAIAYPTFLVLYYFYKLTGSWVAAIFILTLLIRIIFFPLSISSTRSMKKMQEIAPKLEELRKKYADDPQKLQQEMIKLYKEVGFNPFGGCLPILVQIPIFFALYKVLIVTPDLALEGFLWIPSLAEKDPYFILPILMGLTMIAQAWITPSPSGQQNRLMYLMAIIFTFLFATFPSGLVLYWTLNNIFTLIQTWIIYKYLS
ncbi:MAG: membrane protein insertase YidC [Aquificae bacterium]|nr:membrane protein insertase YidC [Aquificota bacterium]